MRRKTFPNHCRRGLIFTITTADLFQIRTAIIPSRKFRFQKGNCITSWIWGSPNKSKAFNAYKSTFIHIQQITLYFHAYGSTLFRYERSPGRYLHRYLSDYIMALDSTNRQHNTYERHISTAIVSLYCEPVTATNQTHT